MNIGVDSMVIIYANLAPAKGKGTQSDVLKALSKRAQLFLLEHEKDEIFLPTIAVSELLVPVPAIQKGAVSAAITERFNCPPFNLQAATIAAELWAAYKSNQGGQQYNRQTLRADVMIIASLKAAGVNHFYSHDKQCRNLANLIMTAKDLPKKPDMNTPGGLFMMKDFEQ
jgi:predicted nucleic acid-binding protein